MSLRQSWAILMVCAIAVALFGNFLPAIQTTDIGALALSIIALVFAVTVIAAVFLAKKTPR